MVKKRELPKCRAVITDAGLSRRLGEDFWLTKKGRDRLASRQEGRLVFYPDRFALMEPDKTRKTTSLKKGDLITLRTGVGRKKNLNNWDWFFTTYVYAGRGSGSY